MKKIALALAGASVALTGLVATPASAADFGRHNDRNRYEQVQKRKVVQNRRVVRNRVVINNRYIDVRGTENETRISVLDRGPGLPVEEIARVTGAFYRAEPSRNRQTGGAGLGLAIADAIVRGHGGTLTFANRDGGGLEAAITLSRSIAVPGSSTRPANIQNKRVGD